MNRRSILKGLLALPFAPLVAKAATKTATPDIKQVARVANIDVRDLGQPMTLLDWAKAHEDRSMLPVIEVLSQRNHLLQEMVWKGPAPIGHKITMGGRLFSGD